MAALYVVGRSWTYDVADTGDPKSPASDTLTIVVKAVQGGKATLDITNHSGTHT